MTLELLFERGINDGPGMHLILAAEHNFCTVPRNPTRHKKGPGKMAEIVILCSKHSAQVIKNRVENFFSIYIYFVNSASCILMSFFGKHDKKIFGTKCISENAILMGGVNIDTIRNMILEPLISGFLFF